MEDNLSKSGGFVRQSARYISGCDFKRLRWVGLNPPYTLSDRITLKPWFVPLFVGMFMELSFQVFLGGAAFRPSTVGVLFWLF